MSERPKKRGCFKYGCFGCLALFALAVGVLLLLGVVSATADRQPRPEEQELSRELPGTVFYPSEDSPDLPERLDLPTSDLPLGTIHLDLAYGEFQISSGPPDQPIRVKADYDAASFILEESFEKDDGDAWTYDLRFGSRGGLLGLLLGGGQNVRNRLELIIPRGRRIDITGRIRMGESESDLTGLWLRNVDLELGTGDHFIELREPSPGTSELFRVDSSMGSLELHGIGHASPKRVDVRHSMGDLLLDLDGRWRGDAEIEGDFGMGSFRVWLPPDVGIDLQRASIGLGEARVDPARGTEPPPGAPTLTVRLSGSMGELRVER